MYKRQVLSQDDLNSIDLNQRNAVFFAIVGSPFSFYKSGEILIYNGSDWELFSYNQNLTATDIRDLINNSNIVIDSARVGILQEVIQHSVVNSASALNAISPASNVLYFVTISADFTDAASVNYKAGETYVYSNDDSSWIRLSGVVNSNTLTITLTYTASPTGGVISNSAGSDVSIPLVDATNAGLISPEQNSKLLNIKADLSSVVSATGIEILSSLGTDVRLPIVNSVESGLMSPALYNKLNSNHVVSILSSTANIDTIVNSGLYISNDVAFTGLSNPFGTAGLFMLIVEQVQLSVNSWHVTQDVFSLTRNNIYYTRAKSYSVAPANLTGVTFGEVNILFHLFDEADLNKENTILTEENTPGSSLSADIVFQQSGSGNSTRYIYDRLAGTGSTDIANDVLERIVIYGNGYAPDPGLQNRITVNVRSSWQNNAASGLNSILFNGRVYQANTLETSRTSEGIAVTTYQAQLNISDERELTINSLQAEINIQAKDLQYLFGTPLKRELKTTTIANIIQHAVPSTTDIENAAKGVIADWAEVGNSDPVPVSKLRRWNGDQSAYDALGTYDSNTLYIITG